MNNKEPIFHNFFDEKLDELSHVKKSPRKIRSDRAVDVKFPVTEDQEFVLKTSFKKCKQVSPDMHLTQTKYNTMLLKYALDHLEIVFWERLYKDTGKYKHTKLAIKHYEQINGLYGIADTRGLTERKTVYLMVISALEFIERTEAYGELIRNFQQ